MAKKLMSWKTKGMNRDLSVSAFNPEFSFENMNLRLSTNEGNTLLSWVNERGTLPLIIGSDDNRVPVIAGTPIGTAVIDHQLVLFTHDENDLQKPDHIYVLTYTNTNKTYMKADERFNGNLGFSVELPLETMVSYESEQVEKVYWVDREHQPRVINLKTDKSRYLKNGEPINTFFDFIPTLELNETVTVTKLYDAVGMFAPGVIQYAFTYYNKYGQESNIFYVTPLQYISHKDRGGSPEEKINNSFKIEVNNVDENFEFLRIYSIHRTSINATPYCRRVQDLEIASMSVSSQNRKTAVFTDTGTVGDSIDPTELLYKGGEPIAVETLEQKGNTLFFGNIKTLRQFLPSGVETYINNTFTPRDINGNNIDQSTTIIDDATQTPITLMGCERVGVAGTVVSTGDIPYINSINCSYFKWNEIYRFGIQFQHETGRWSDPVWLRDLKITKSPSIDGATLNLPQVKVMLPDSTCIAELINNNYKKARLLMAQPTISGRTILCQGIANPTVSQESRRATNLYSQASWFFRPKCAYAYGQSMDEGSTGGGFIPSQGSVGDYDGLNFAVKSDDSVVLSPGLNNMEIGAYLGRDAVDNDKSFTVFKKMFTINTPELIFDESLFSEDWNSKQMHVVGYTKFDKTFGDIDIQTETPTIGSAQGFIHTPIKTVGNAGLISGLFYEDYIADEGESDGHEVRRYPDMKCPVLWPVALWQRTGSLNNDINRDGRSAKLLKKKISNYHVSLNWFPYNTSSLYITDGIQLFNSEEVSIIKIKGKNYMGNIDTSITPENPQVKYFSGNPYRDNPRKKSDSSDSSTTNRGFWIFDSPISSSSSSSSSTDDDGDYGKKIRYCLAYNNSDVSTSSEQGMYEVNTTEKKWEVVSGGSSSNVGDYYKDLCETSEPVRMTYKSTPHLVVLMENATSDNNIFDVHERTVMCDSSLPLVEIRNAYNSNIFYGGQTDDALKANVWIPISEPVKIEAGMTLTSNRGDTYFQRFDCLKTYALTREDINQVVEIASFMVETHINIDGRYDRNRGQTNNLNMSPQNYNLYNPVYSQQDNFFSYRIPDKDTYKDTFYPNQITWSKAKTSGADVDLWTNVTLASILELDGDKGSISKLTRLNDKLIAFQDTGISQILYDENTQISTAEGVPIEIANSGKVQGKRYLSDTVGCSNKWSICNTPAGIYFVSNSDKSIYRLGDGLQNVSQQGGFNSWCKQNIATDNIKWTPKFSIDTNSKSPMVTYYDKLNQDVMFIGKDTALAFSEKFGVFTSFYDYGSTPFLCSLDDTNIWVRNNGSLWKHQAGDYCKFFGSNKPYWITLVGNPEPQTDKIFTNLEFRACVDGDGYTDGVTGKYNFYLPFESLETWNEYQHGIAYLGNKNGHDLYKHHTADRQASLKRKFRIWRCDIPRDNYGGGVDVFDYTFDYTFHGTGRTSHSMDRMRNPWLYLKLMKNAATRGETLNKTEIHDLIMTYYN